MNHQQVQDQIDQALRQRQADNLLRQRRIIDPIDEVRVRLGDQELINFSSNDYLGLSHHRRLARVIAKASRSGCGSGAAGLISGYTSAHAQAEAAIARWKQTERAVLLPSGYQANLAAIQTFTAIGQLGGGVRFLADKLIHASLIDAIQTSGQPYRIFPHNQFPKLERLLTQADPNQLQVVVTESIFSMDGDAADLPGLAQLKGRYAFQLLLDEAHASGVWGENGCGYADEIGYGNLADVSIVTCSKGMGLIGGVICASERFCAMLCQAGRAYIYSTSIPPHLCAAVEAALEIMRADPQRRARVRRHASMVRKGLSGSGLIVLGQDESPIIPIVVGSEQNALEAAQKLQQQGLLVAAVRPPTVAVNASRLRITVTSAHRRSQIAQLVSALRNLQFDAVSAKKD